MIQRASVAAASLAFRWDADKLEGAAIVGVGGVFVLAGVWFFLRQALLLCRARTAPGEVVELAPTDGCFAPVFRFRDHREVVRTVRSGSASNPPGYRVGDRVVVLFDPRRPEEAQIRSFASLWLPGIIVIGLGAVVVAVGVLRLLSGG